jgi:DNA-directed RNA polymerase subunit RPC12/RpoP
VPDVRNRGISETLHREDAQAMKHRCPKCGHRWESKAKNQAKGGAARWAGMTKAERSAEMKRVRAARLANNR